MLITRVSYGNFIICNTFVDGKSRNDIGLLQLIILSERSKFPSQIVKIKLGHY